MVKEHKQQSSLKAMVFSGIVMLLTSTCGLEAVAMGYRHANTNMAEENRQQSPKDEIKEGLSRAVEEGKENIKTTKEKVQEKASEVADKTKEAAKSIKEDISKASQHAKGKASDAAENAKKAAKSMKEGVSQSWDHAKEKVQG